MRKRKTAQYAEFASLVQIQTQPEEQRFIKRYAISINVVKVLCLCWLILALILFIANAIAEVISVRTAFRLVILSDVCVLVTWFAYRYRYAAKINDVWSKDCDIVKYLGIYNELVTYAPARSNWGVHFYNLTMGLLESGRAEDAEKVQPLAEKYSTNNMGRFLCEMAAIELAGYRKDYKGLEEHCRRLSWIQTKVRLTRSLRSGYIFKMQYHNYLQMSERGAYRELYNIFDQREATADTISSRVRCNYYLYKIALRLGDEEKAKEHKAYVIQRGGSTRYRAELMGHGFQG